MRMLSGRAVTLHLLLLLTLSLCGVAAWWQVGRALSGNTLSWLYVFEWPAFGAIAGWLWWVLVTGASPPPPVAPARRELRWDEGLESPALRAYNAYLTELQSGWRPVRPR
jgi:hypothetical protein